MSLAQSMLEAVRPAPWWIDVCAKVIRKLPLARYRLSKLLPRTSRPFIGKNDNTGKFICDVRDMISRDVYFTGRYEPVVSALLGEILRPGMVFLDVGANWGYFTLIAAKLVGSTGNVVSLEPEPRLFTWLQANVELNSFGNVKCLQVAASDDSTGCHLTAFDETEGNFGLSRLQSKRSDSTFEAESCCLDDLLDQVAVDRSAVDLVKIDIEGAEGKAIRGMERGLDEHRYQRIMIEFHPELLSEHGDSVEAIIRQLRERGYRGWQLDHSPQAVRRASYARAIDVKDYLNALRVEDQDAWPHTFWIAPETETLW